MHYVGRELRMFDAAENWNRYACSFIAPHVSGKVLEVGAGIGRYTKHLCHLSPSWDCLEPDSNNAVTLARRAIENKWRWVRVIKGTTEDLLDRPERYDTILVLDTLEHIHDDAAELGRAKELLARDGKLVILAPAHQWLYSDFDLNLAHYRRYTAESLSAILPDGMAVKRWHYLDCASVLLLLANKHLAMKRNPSAVDMWLFDRVCVRVSRWLDKLLAYRVGKSVLAVAEVVE